MNHNTPPFTFGAQVDMINPKLLHEVLMSPVPQGKKFMCRIVRKNEGIDKRIYPTYELSLEEPSRPQRIFLLRATKKKRSRGSYYAITSEPEFTYDYDRKASDENYGVLGKLRSNFLGTAFNVYSNGRNPFSSGEHNGDGAHDQQSLSPMEKEKQRLRRENSGKNMTVRQELGAVIYSGEGSVRKDGLDGIRGTALSKSPSVSAWE
ncbi:hypothetical protein BGZ49_005173 [Haplosporangium sp. Z 27]|nr:hypothetical protein BGZ49_005173 [Haplosporangium sp. Z 27]